MLPRAVRSAVDKLTDEVESNPDFFMRFVYRPRLRTICGRLANMIGAQAHECVFVRNATHGLNTILRNLQWSADDVIVSSEHAGTTSNYLC